VRWGLFRHENQRNSLKLSNITTSAEHTITLADKLLENTTNYCNVSLLETDTGCLAV